MVLLLMEGADEGGWTWVLLGEVVQMLGGLERLPRAETENCARSISASAPGGEVPKGALVRREEEPSSAPSPNSDAGGGMEQAGRAEDGYRQICDDGEDHDGHPVVIVHGAVDGLGGVSLLAEEKH